MSLQEYLNYSINISTSASIILTNCTIPNIVSTNSSISSLLSINNSFTNLASTFNTFANNLTSLQTTGTLTVTTSASLIGNTNTIGSIFTTGGNVGINTTSPGFSLDVNGTGRFTNLISTNITTNAIVTSVITTSSLLSTNINSTNITTSSILATNVILTSGSFGNISSSNISVSGNMTIGGNLLVAGTLIAVNTTSVNIIDNNITAGTLNAGSITSSNLFSTNNSLTNLISTNSSISSLNTTNLLSTNITTSAILSTNSTITNLVLTSGTFSNKVGGSQTVGTLVITTSASLIGNTNTIGNLFTTGGNVGINNTSPGLPLDVNGIIRSNIPTPAIGNNDAIYIGQSLSNNNTAIIDYNYTTIGSSLNSIGLGFFGANNKLVVQAGGNVGINTTSPSYTLDINGSLRVSSLYVNSTSIIAVGGTTTLSTAANTNQFVVGTSGHIVLLPNTTGLAIGAEYYIVNQSSQAITVGNNSSTALNILNPGSSEYFTLTSNTGAGGTWAYLGGNVINGTTGNVGINTTSPAFTLDVNGTTKVNSTSGIILSSSVGANTRVDFTYSNPSTYLGIAASARIQSVDNNYGADLLFQNRNQGTDNTTMNTRMTIAAGGNVGINTTSPTFTLDVAGSLRSVALNSTQFSPAHTLVNTGILNPSVVSLLAPNVSTGNNVSTMFGQSLSSNNSGQLNFQYFGNNNTTNNISLSFFGGATGTPFTISANGNIGLNNIATPIYPLHVSGNIYAGTSSFTSSGSGTLNTIGLYTKGVFNSGVNGFPTVSGTTGNAIALRVRGNDDAVIDFGINSGAGGWLQTTNYTGYSSNYPLLLNPNGGNIGINTTSPGFTLDVNGSARITTSLTTGSVFSTNITSSNIFATNSTLTNLISTNITTTNLISSVITTGSLLSNNINSTNSTLTNLISTNITTTNLISSAILSTNSTITNLVLTSETFSNKVGGSQTTGTIVVTTSASLIGNTNTIGSIFTTGGNVGINTTSPGFTLDVNGTGRFTNLISTNITTTNLIASTITISSLLSTNINSTNLTTSNLLSTNVTSSNFISTFNTFANTIAGGQTIGTLTVTTSASLIGNTNTIGNLFTTGGNVGINTTSPQFTLDVNGATRITSSITSLTGGTCMITNTGIIGQIYPLVVTSPNTNNSGIILGQSQTNFNCGQIGFNYVTTGSSLNTISLQAYGNQTGVYVNQNYVGINTTSPTYTLDINGNSRITSRLDIGGTQPSFSTNTIGQLFITGPSSTSNGPNLLMNTSQDIYPTFQLLNFAHDNISLNFDLYFDTTFRTSSSTGGFQIYKLGSQLKFTYSAGTAGSNANNPPTAMAIGSTGSLIINNSAFMGLNIGNNINIGTSTNAFTGGNGILQVTANTSTGSTQDCISCRAQNNTNYIISFYNTGGSMMGSVQGTSATSVAYNTSSDIRLKNNIKPLSKIMDTINKINVVEFNWNNCNTYDNGFIAQEIFKLFPHMRPDISSYTDCTCKNNHTIKDLCDKVDHENPVKSDGSNHTYGLDYGKMTPYLVKGLQEQQEQINSQQNQIDTLLSFIKSKFPNDQIN